MHLFEYRVEQWALAQAFFGYRDSRSRQVDGSFALIIIRSRCTPPAFGTFCGASEERGKKSGRQIENASTTLRSTHNVDRCAVLTTATAKHSKAQSSKMRSSDARTKIKCTDILSRSTQPQNVHLPKTVGGSNSTVAFSSSLSTTKIA